jgi:hypothetical protein
VLINNKNTLKRKSQNENSNSQAHKQTNNKRGKSPA